MIKVVQPLPLPRLLDLAIEETRKPRHELLALVAVVLAVTGGFYSFLSTLYLQSLEAGLGCGALIATMFFLPVMLLINAAGYSALGISAARRVFGQEETVRETLRYLVRPKVLGTLAFTGVLITLSAFFFLLPAILTSALFSLVFPAMVIEGRFGVDAIRRSSELVWRNPSGTLRKAPLLIMLTIQGVFFAISFLLSLALQLPYQIVTQAAVWRAATSDGGASGLAELTGVFWLQIPTSVASTLVSTAAGYCFFHCLALYYRDLRERREALSIQQVLERWDQATAASMPPGGDSLGAEATPE